jgi:malate/lactate dehydrogenase
MPQLIGGEGVIATLPLDLSEAERNALHDSAKTIRDAIDELEDAA